MVLVLFRHWEKCISSLGVMVSSGICIRTAKLIVCWKAWPHFTSVDIITYITCPYKPFFFYELNYQSYNTIATQRERAKQYIAQAAENNQQALSGEGVRRREQGPQLPTDTRLLPCSGKQADVLKYLTPHTLLVCMTWWKSHKRPQLLARACYITLRLTRDSHETWPAY